MRRQDESRSTMSEENGLEVGAITIQGWIWGMRDRDGSGT